jgi:hypothetical protein
MSISRHLYPVIPAKAGIHEEQSGAAMAGSIATLAFTRTGYDQHLWYPRNDASELPGIEERAWKSAAKSVWQRRSNVFGGSASLMGR